MKNAILILAHKEFPLLLHLVDYFSQDCYVFIHIDKKANVSKQDISILLSKPQVIAVYRKYNVNWGGFSILRTELFLFKEAIRLCDATYFHIISGLDYPIKPLTAFLDFFERNQNLNFISCGNVGDNRLKKKNAYFRYQYFLPYDQFRGNRKQIWKKINRFVEFQRRIGVSRGIPVQFNRIYCGSQWLSVPLKTVRDILKYTKEKPAFYRRLRYTFAPEETYFQTIIVNMCPRENVVFKNYRFIRWKNENNNSPANLSMIHFHLLVESDDFFARKMEMPYCNDIITKIDKYLLIEKYYTEPFLINTYDFALTKALYSYCKWLNIRNVLDFGCGPGLYVAALRRLGLLVAGYDESLYMRELSTVVIPEGDYPCEIANLADDMEEYETFQLVYCINVLQYIEISHLYKAVKNLIFLTNKTLLLGWNDVFERDRNKSSYVKSIVEEEGLFINEFATKFFQNQVKRVNYIYVFERTKY